MKKILFSIGLLSVLSVSAIAQSIGGIPYSFSSKLVTTNPTIAYPALDMEAIAEQDIADNNSLVAKPMRIAQSVMADIDINKYSNIAYLDNGDMVWSIAVSIPGAKVIDVYFDKLVLPKGAKVFFYNENKRQIDGAYTQEQVTAEGYLRSDYVQGEKIFIEINFPAGTNIEDCVAHINKFGAYYRGELPLSVASLYAKNEGEVQTEANERQDDVCYVNANCEGYGTKFYEMKQTAVHLDMGGYICSGNMINNTAFDGTPYLLTASHCEGSNSFSNATFSTWKFYFNYESTTCTYGDRANINNFVTGANFVARSNNALNVGNELIGDFLLLKLRASAANIETRGFNAYLGGWDNTGLIGSDTSWIFFHHPAGMRKKVSYSKSINRNGTFNQTAIRGTHWQVDTFIVSGTQGGSSGSAIFSTTNGHIIGDLSGGAAHENVCGEMKVRGALYSKLSEAWLNVRGEGGTTDTTSLKKWLDPTNSGRTSIGMSKISSTESGEITLNGGDPNSIKRVDISSNVHVYPNPNTGIARVNINLPEASNINIEVVNILGQLVKTMKVSKTTSTDLVIDMTEFHNGVYLINVTTDKGMASKKLVLSK